MYQPNTIPDFVEAIFRLHRFFPLYLTDIRLFTIGCKNWIMLNTTRGAKFSTESMKRLKPTIWSSMSISVCCLTKLRNIFMVGNMIRTTGHFLKWSAAVAGQAPWHLQKENLNLLESVLAPVLFNGCGWAVTKKCNRNHYMVSLLLHI